MSLERVRLGMASTLLGPEGINNSAEERAETSQFTPGLSVFRLPSCSLVHSNKLLRHIRKAHCHTRHVGRELSSAHHAVATLASTASENCYCSIP